MGNGFFSKVQILELISKTPFVIMRHKQPFLESDSAYTKSTKLPQIDQLGCGYVLKIFFFSLHLLSREVMVAWCGEIDIVSISPRVKRILPTAAYTESVVKCLLYWFWKSTFELGTFYLSWFFIQTEQVKAVMAQASSQIPYMCLNVHCCAQNRWAAVDTLFCEMHVLSYRISTW